MDQELGPQSVIPSKRMLLAAFSAPLARQTTLCTCRFHRCLIRDSADKVSGAVKSNIGHLEGGSGIAGIIKTVLVLEKGIIPPISSNFERLNPQIDVEFLNIKVYLSLADMKQTVANIF